MTSQMFACALHKFFFAVHKTNKTTKYISEDDDDTGDISTCDMEATHDEIAKIWRKQVI